ncbi:MAG TPA: ribosomal protein S18-alanine N-acetyltransferase [Thermoanaerobaculia bacterium]|nr:ribosomal protein S18-alanine N-acetyltransferase [Thermoanaerobaculia bacterium]
MALRRPEQHDYRLVPVESEHLDEIARIEHESFPVPWKREFFETELSESFRYARVLVRPEGPPPVVGGYLFAISLYDEFHINKIATDSRLRQLGYGRMLLEDALARARAARSAAVTLEVRVSNTAAREFYHSYGFREAYRRRRYYQDGEDAFAMVLPLGPSPEVETVSLRR